MAEEGKVYDDVNAAYYVLKKELDDKLDGQKESWKKQTDDIIRDAEVDLEKARKLYEEEKKRQEKEYDELFQVTDLRARVGKAQSIV